MTKIIVNVFGNSPVQVEAPAGVEVIINHHKAVPAQRAVKVPHTTGLPAPDRGEGWYRYTRPDGFTFCATVCVSDKEWAADRRRRDKMAAKYGTQARNAALLSIGTLTLQQWTSDYVIQAQEYRKRHTQWYL